jgi:hypothetical protein
MSTTNNRNSYQGRSGRRVAVRAYHATLAAICAMEPDEKMNGEGK